MIITEHGDIMLFICQSCGCKFREAVKKTGLEYAGVWDKDREENGAWMDCPDCGEKVLGFRKKKQV